MNKFPNYVCCAVFALSFFAPVITHASPYLYGRFGEVADSRVVISFESLDDPVYFVCDISQISCENKSTFAPKLVTLDNGFEQKNYFFNPERNKMFVSEEIVSQGKIVVQNAVYSIVEGKPLLESILSTHERVFRALFSADGSRIILITRDGNLVSINTDTKKSVFKKPFKDKASATRITLSPNGKFIAYYIPATSSRNTRVFKLWDLANNKTYEQRGTVYYWDLLSEDLKLFEFAPDNSSLVYLDDRDNFATLYRVNLESISSLRGVRIIAKPYVLADFLFRDSHTIYFTANRENPYEWSLYRYDLINGDLVKVQDDVSYSQMIKKNGSKILFLHRDTNGVFPQVLDAESNEVFALPTLLPKVLDKKIKEEVVSFSGLYAVLARPQNYDSAKTYPLLIWLHGGPYRQASLGYHPYFGYAGYEAILEEAVRNGALVLKLDYTGSYGYGRVFAEGIKNNVGKKDVADVLRAIEYAKKNLSIGHIYLMGNSYGAYLSLQTIVEKPLLISGVISINGVTDWELLLRNLQNSIFNMYFNGTPKSGNQQLYDQASIVKRIDNLTDNTILLLKGEDDTTIPGSQSDILYAKLFEEGKNAKLVGYEGEGHILKKKESLEDLCSRTLRMMGISIKKGVCNF